MTKKVACFALGGHITTQNASYKKLIQCLEPQGYRFFGAEDGFKAFDTGNVYELTSDCIPREFAGFIAGAGRNSLTNKDGTINYESLEKAKDFFKRGKFDIAVGSGGDNHGMQMDILNKHLDNLDVYVLNKTMDNDLGGMDGTGGAPHTDFTNGFHSAVVHCTNMIRQHYAGAWTNNLPYLIGHFGRESNWVGIAASYWGLADKLIYGELSEEHPGHSLETIAENITEAQDRNEKEYGRRFAMVVVPEGSKIQGINHASQELGDVHGHPKLQPELLVNELKTALETKYNLKTQTIGLTYELRNFTPTNRDLNLAESSAKIIAKTILEGKSGMESTFKIQENRIVIGTKAIEKVSKKRLASYYPKQLINPDTFEITEEIGEYYKPLFGQRENLRDWLPNKPSVVNIYED